ncbi:hypothetical protein D3C71_1685680 [compost metagenome]
MNIIKMLTFFIELLMNFFESLMPSHSKFTKNMLRVTAQCIPVFLLLMSHLPNPGDKLIHILKRPSYTSMLNMHLNLEQLDADLELFNNLMTHKNKLHGIFGETIDCSAALFPATAGRILIHHEILIFLHRHLPSRIIIIIGFEIPTISAPEQAIY